MMKPNGIVVAGPLLAQGAVCGPILRALPAWFGIEEATQHYIQEVCCYGTLDVQDLTLRSLLEVMLTSLLTAD